MIRIYVVACLLGIGLAVATMLYASSAQDILLLGGVVVILFLFALMIILTNSGLLTAARLATLEKKRSNDAK
jgi:hypothetical protein